MFHQCFGGFFALNVGDSYSNRVRICKHPKKEKIMVFLPEGFLFDSDFCSKTCGCPYDLEQICPYFRFEEIKLRLPYIPLVNEKPIQTLLTNP